MLYGLYLSAAGTMTASHRSDVIANNLANVETTGFKRQLSAITERDVESRARGTPNASDRMLDQLTGGQFVSPSVVDQSPGAVENTGNPTDVAVRGAGRFAIQDGDAIRLTRNGGFIVDQNNNLVMASDRNRKVLGRDQQPIKLPSATPIDIQTDGSITQAGVAVATVGLFDVADESKLKNTGGTLLDPQGQTLVPTASPQMVSGSLERSNVDPATELTTLMECQRLLEANANMIRYQDQTLGRLVNDVARVS